MTRLRTAVFALMCALGLAAAAPAQTTTITASHLKILGFPVPSGIVTIVAVNSSGQAITFADATGAQNGTVGTITTANPVGYQCTITAGAIGAPILNALSPGTISSGPCTVPDSALTTPANILYTFIVCDTSTGNRTSGKCYTVQSVPNVTGSTWALDHYGPPAQTSNVAALQAAVGATTPSSCILPSVFTNSTTHVFYTCVGGVFVATNAVPYLSNVTGATQATCASDPTSGNTVSCTAMGVSSTELSGAFAVQIGDDPADVSYLVATITLPTHGPLGDVCTSGGLIDTSNAGRVALVADGISTPGTLSLYFQTSSYPGVNYADSAYITYSCVRAVAP